MVNLLFQYIGGERQMNEEEYNEKVNEVMEIIDGIPYFEQVLILEMLRDSLRIFWMNDIGRSIKEEKQDDTL